MAHVCSIIVPAAGATGTGQLDEAVHWVLSAQLGRAIEFVILATRIEFVPVEPAQCVVGSLPLGNGNAVWVLFQDVPLHLPTEPQSGQPRFFSDGRDQLEAAIYGGHARVVGYSVRESDRLRILMETAIVRRPSAERSQSV
jgi:hypothetical protein